jgi:branched-chain amino acid transport system permease protein
MSSGGWQVRRGSRSAWRAWSLCLLALAVLASAPAWATRDILRTGTELFVYLSLAMLWNLIAGYAGLMSIGQQAYVGIGAYVLFASCSLLQLHPLAAIALGGVAGMIVAVPASVVLFRLSGAYFAVTSWVIAEIVMLVISQLEPVGAGSGMSLPVSAVRMLGSTPTTRASVLWTTALAMALATLLGSWLWLRSSHGLALMAIRDNESAADTLGINVRRNKLLVYVLAAFGASCAGAIAFLTKLRISPVAAFDVQEWTASIIFIVVSGGIGSLEGPIVGTVLFFLLRYWFADYGTWYLMLLGAIAVTIMLVAPAGLWGLLQQRTGWQLLPTARRLERTKG